MLGMKWAVNQHPVLPLTRWWWWWRRLTASTETIIIEVRRQPDTRLCSLFAFSALQPLTLQHPKSVRLSQWSRTAAGRGGRGGVHSARAWKATLTHRVNQRTRIRNRYQNFSNLHVQMATAVAFIADSTEVHWGGTIEQWSRRGRLVVRREEKVSKSTEDKKAL